MTRILTRPYDVRAAASLQQCGHSAPIARALAARGITCREDLEQEWKGLLSPAMLEGTREAVERLALARERGERVIIVADYDCDGATACVVGLRGLRAMGLTVDYLVPDRVLHGYGLTDALVDIIAGMNPRPDLILTVDNGVSSAAPIARAAAMGIDTVVTDHHLPGPELPKCAAIVNPNLPDSAFPSKALAGVGVMYYVLLTLRALLRERGVYDQTTQPRLDQLVDFVALGTVADVVRLDKNNRILVAQGLKRIRQGRTHPGILALFSVARRDAKEASVADFGFAVGPRINAAGRLASMETGIECLLADDPERAHYLADCLNNTNQERRTLEAEMQETALAAIAGTDLEQTPALAIYDEGFNEGVVGLVAARIREKTNRPVVAFAPSESGNLKGSGRSIPGVHLRDAIDLVAKRLPDAVLKFGGHAMAAGLTLRPERLADFRAAFEEAVRTLADPHAFEHTVMTDGELRPTDITERLVMETDRQIWGQGFEPPLFANTFRVLSQKIVKDAHLKLTLELGTERFGAIFFRRTAALPGTVRLAYRPVINAWNGRRTVELVVEAAEAAE